MDEMEFTEAESNMYDLVITFWNDSLLTPGGRVPTVSRCDGRGGRGI